jgi:hypothetical protein
VELLAAPMSLDDLADAAAAAFGLGSLTQRDGVATIARRTAVHVALATVGAPGVAALLGMPKRTVYRHSRQPVPPDFASAVVFQLRLRGHRRARAASERSASMGMIASDQGPPMATSPVPARASRLVSQPGGLDFGLPTRGFPASRERGV